MTKPIVEGYLASQTVIAQGYIPGVSTVTHAGGRGRVAGTARRMPKDLLNRK